jgi:hypothetical protein
LKLGVKGADSNPKYYFNAEESNLEQMPLWQRPVYVPSYSHDLIIPLTLFADIPKKFAGIQYLLISSPGKYPSFSPSPFLFP